MSNVKHLLPKSTIEDLEVLVKAMYERVRELEVEDSCTGIAEWDDGFLKGRISSTDHWADCIKSIIEKHK